jgi:hypothetical protein
LLRHFQKSHVRKYAVVTKSGKSFSPSVNLLWHALIAALFLFGFLLVQVMTQEDGEITRQVTGNDTGEFIVGTPILAPEAGVQQTARKGDSQEYYSVKAYPETDYTVDGSNDRHFNATTESIVASIDPIYHESGPPQASPALDEFDHGYQQDSYHEYNDSATSHGESQDIVQYVDREVVKEVLVEKPVELRPFDSLEELETWLAEDDTNEYVYLFAGKDGVCQPSDRYDCDDYAFQLQRRAVNSGFLISVTIIEKRGKPHMINLADIGNRIYYIEPQSDKVWFYCNRD